MEDWWKDVEDDLLRCFEARTTLAPAEIAARVGMSEQCVTSLIALLASEGRLKICLVTRD